MDLTEQNARGFYTELLSKLGFERGSETFEALMTPEAMETWSLAFKNRSHGLNPSENYESLEKLGDASLDFNLTKMFFNKYFGTEGFTKSKLTNITKALASNDHLQKIASRLRLLTTVPSKGKELADIVESLLGAAEVIGDRAIGRGYGVIIVSKMVDSLYDIDTIDIDKISEQSYQNKVLTYYDRLKFEHPLVVYNDDDTGAVVQFSDKMIKVYPDLPLSLHSSGHDRRETTRNIYQKILKEFDNLNIEFEKKPEIVEDVTASEEDVKLLTDFMIKMVRVADESLTSEAITELVRNPKTVSEIKKVARLMKKTRGTLIEESIGVSTLSYMVVKYLYDSRNGKVTPAILNDAKDYLVTEAMLRKTDLFLKIPRFEQKEENVRNVRSPRRVYLFFYLLDYIFEESSDVPRIGSIMSYNIIKTIIEDHQNVKSFNLALVAKDVKESVKTIFSQMKLGPVSVFSEGEGQEWTFFIRFLPGSKIDMRAKKLGVDLPELITSKKAPKREAEADAYRQVKIFLNILGFTEHIAALAIISNLMLRDGSFLHLYRKATRRNFRKKGDDVLRTLMFTTSGNELILYSYSNLEMTILAKRPFTRSSINSARIKLLKDYLDS